MPSDAKFVKLLYVHHFYTCNITVYIFSTFYFVSLCVFYVVFSITDNSNIAYILILCLHILHYSSIQLSKLQV